MIKIKDISFNKIKTINHVMKYAYWDKKEENKFNRKFFHQLPLFFEDNIIFYAKDKKSTHLSGQFDNATQRRRQKYFSEYYTKDICEMNIDFTTVLDYNNNFHTINEMLINNHHVEFVYNNKLHKGYIINHHFDVENYGCARARFTICIDSDTYNR